MAGADGYGANGMPAGKGKGQRIGQPDGRSGADAGHGTTDRNQGYSGQMTYNSAKQRQSGHRSNWNEKYQSIYAPERVASTRIDTQVSGKKGKDKGNTDYQTVRDAPDASSASQPYYEVYSSYRHAAENALDKEDVPATYKKQVRDYFDSLRP